MKPELEDLHFLKTILARTESRLHEYRKIMIIWAVIIILDSAASQLLIYYAAAIAIPFIWIGTVIAGIIISHFAAKAIRKNTKINAFLARFISLLWLGGITAIFFMLGIILLVPAISLQYITALSFPVLGLCIFGTAALFKIRIGYFISILFFASSIPAAVFIRYAMLIQAVVAGGGTLILGLIKNEQT